MAYTQSWGMLKWTLMGALGLQVNACGGATDDSNTPNGGNGGESSGSGGNSQGSGGSSNTELPACTNPVEGDGGFITCDEDYVSRPTAGACEDQRPRSEQIGDSATCDPTTSTCCLYDSDCSGDLEYCSFTPQGAVPEPISYCSTGCLVDADCGENSVCLCNGGVMGFCTPAECSTDADCPGEARCTSWSKDEGCGEVVTFSCQTAADECGGPADCESGQECVVVDGARKCQEQIYTCAFGRPFLVNEEIRIAEIEERADWLCAEGTKVNALCVEPLSEDERAVLAAYFEESAQLEHASIAAFARFSLQLLSLGAPADLIERCNQAMVDETRHARLCFEWVSRYRGQQVGPGPLSLKDVRLDHQLEEIVAMVIAEGCVGETVAALLASESASQASEAAIVSGMSGIFADESRHAELAWRFMRWVLQAQPQLRPFIEAQFAQHVAQATLDVEQTDFERATSSGRQVRSAQLRAHGMLDAAQSAELRHRALKEIVAPCAQQLLKEEKSSGRELGATTAGVSFAAAHQNPELSKHVHTHGEYSQS